MATLTDKFVRTVLPPERGQAEYRDDAVKHFMLRVSPGGTKTFVVLVGARRRRYSLGRYPLISLAQARELARQVLAKETLGALSPTTMTFKDALDIYVASYLHVNNKPSTAYEAERILRKDWERHFGTKALGKISVAHITNALDTLVGKPSAANHAFATLRTFMNWCRQRGYITTSPCEVLSLPAPVGKRERVLTDQELQKLITYLLRPDNDPLFRDFKAIVMLLILTGQRRQEIGSLRKEWIGDSTISYPSTFTKNKREHVLPLTSGVKAIIDSQQHEGDFVFGKEWNYWNKTKKRLDEGCDVTDWTLHDLRRTCATGMAKIGIEPHIIERILNHASGEISGVSAIYNRNTYVPEMLRALTAWEQKLYGLVSS